MKISMLNFGIRFIKAHVWDEVRCALVDGYTGRRENLVRLCFGKAVASTPIKPFNDIKADTVMHLSQ